MKLRSFFHVLNCQCGFFCRRLLFLTFHLDIEPVHITTGRAAAWWAFLLLMPYHLFASTDAFRGLAAHGCEWKWGCIMLPLALLSALCLFTPKAWLQVLTLASGVFIWGFVAAFLAQVSRHVPLFGLYWIALNTGVGVYTGMSLDCTRALMRACIYLTADVSLLIGRLRKKWTPPQAQEKDQQAQEENQQADQGGEDG